MEGCYEVYFGNRASGKVQVMRQGLYYRIVCRCRIPSDQVYRLYAAGGSIRESLGVLVPEGDGFALDKKIPVKRLGEKPLHFEVSSGRPSEGYTGHPSSSGEFIPICPEEPFLYIDRLKTAFLQTQNGKVGIRMEKRPEAG